MAEPKWSPGSLGLSYLGLHSLPPWLARGYTAFPPGWPLLNLQCPVSGLFARQPIFLPNPNTFLGYFFLIHGHLLQWSQLTGTHWTGPEDQSQAAHAPQKIGPQYYQVPGVGLPSLLRSCKTRGWICSQLTVSSRRRCLHFCAAGMQQALNNQCLTSERPPCITRTLPEAECTLLS